MKKVRWLVPVVIILSLFSGLCSCSSSSNKIQELAISNIVFCSEEPAGYMDYKEQPGAIYNAGDVVWVYFNVTGEKFNENADGEEIWLTEMLSVKDSAGTVLLSEEVVNEHRNLTGGESTDKIFLTNFITTTADLSPGGYTIELVVTDKLADTSAAASSTFTLE